MADINALIARGFGPFQSFSELEAKREQERLQNELSRMKLAQGREQMKGLPEEKKWKEESREWERKERGYKEKKQEREEETAKIGQFKTGLEVLENAKKTLPGVTFEKYP